ncbi:hypothetical protein RIF29_39024 [Crotalaria pallida]|uniref:Uncharacterized protein n=1 Tax=Crotalaria pallida TaxID=3830 RepID=A0AAN9E1A6_CROPI
MEGQWSYIVRGSPFQICEGEIWFQDSCSYREWVARGKRGDVTRWVDVLLKLSPSSCNKQQHRFVQPSSSYLIRLDHHHHSQLSSSISGLSADLDYKGNNDNSS